MVKKFFKFKKPSFDFRYLLPTVVSNKYHIGVRKRLLSKGYQIYRFVKHGNEQINEHIVYVDTIEQMHTYLKNEYCITIQ